MGTIGVPRDMSTTDTIFLSNAVQEYYSGLSLWYCWDKRKVSLYPCDQYIQYKFSVFNDNEYSEYKEYIITVGGIHSSVVARWTAGQQVEWLILHQGHDSWENSSH